MSDIDVVRRRAERWLNDPVKEDWEAHYMHNGCLLSQAIKLHDNDLVSRLVAAGYPFSEGVSSEETPLGVAAIVNNVQAAWILLAAGASPDGWEFEDLTPLQQAIRYGHLDIVTLLFEYGANPNCARRYDCPLSAFSTDPKVLQFVRQLLSRQV
ncbi:MAG: ankyrin repeat domain-containing protein [Phycisphaerales bacterium]|nr:ankyrin repeat domain-containing protein [Phycisphaerales bacterium]